MTLNVFNDKWGLKRVSVYILYQLRLRQTIGYRRMDWTENSFIDDFGLKNSATIIFIYFKHANCYFKYILKFVGYNKWVNASDLK